MPTNPQERTYNRLLNGLAKLDDAHKRKLLADLKKSISPDPSSLSAAAEELRDKRFRMGLACPHCGGTKVVRNGTQRGWQRYACKAPDCGKTFSDHTCSPLRGTHFPEKWLSFMECMVNGMSLRKTAARLKISLGTAFVWRHKVLTALRRLEVGDFEGILEVDETFFLYSEKGKKDIKGRDPRKRGGSATKRGISSQQVCVVVARDRNKLTLSGVACCGAISRLKAHVMLGKHVGAVTAVCSDANGTWKSFANDIAVDHKELNFSKKRRSIQRIFHIQNVNNYHARLKKWLERFNGVASKFLDNYLAWFRFLDAHTLEAMPKKKQDLLVSACLAISPERYREIHATEFVLPA